MAVLDSRQWSPPLLDQTLLLHHSFCGRSRSDHRDRCNECCKGRCKFHASSSLNGSHTLGNAVATLGGHRLGNDPKRGDCPRVLFVALVRYDKNVTRRIDNIDIGSNQHQSGQNLSARYLSPHASKHHSPSSNPTPSASKSPVFHGKTRVSRRL